jgi:hypothetical protein
MKTQRAPIVATAASGLACVLALAGCSPIPARTIDGMQAFEQHALRVDLASPTSVEQLARCFEASAGLLPGSTLASHSRPDEFVYRLRAGQYVFESIAVTAVADGGSRALVLVTPDYNSRMREDFVANRLAPLYRCAGAPTSPRWPGSRSGLPVAAIGVGEAT